MSSLLSSLSAIVLLLQMIMNVSNNNNLRKNENNNNNNQNNNNNINEGIDVLLNEFQNMVTAMGTGVPAGGGRSFKSAKTTFLPNVLIDSLIQYLLGGRQKK